jgi:signal transduction histidine kinase
MAADHAEWAASLDFPDLISEAFWVTEETGPANAGRAPERRLDIARVSLETGELIPMEWPPWLAVLQQPLAESADDHRGGPLHESDSFTAYLGNQDIAFVVAQTQLRQKGWAVAVLRSDVMIGQFLPSLVRDHYGPDSDREYEVRLFDEAAGNHLVFASATDPSASGPAPDVVRHLRDFGGVYRSRDEGGGRSLAVAVNHRAGSVAAAVSQLRRRNLGFGFGVVLVLGASVGVLAIAARRARQLAQRQMEFVAGVSHELRTPIAGISSLSQNLADGVVQDIEHAARYGETIHKESRRLGNMVEGVLHFSAIRSGRYRYEMGTVEVSDVIGKALEGLDATAVERFALEVSIQEELPPLLGDERALRSVVRNLVSNAMKFSEPNGEIRLSAAVRERRGNPEIELLVEDAGQGIAASDLAHVFEPFFRGHAAQTGQVEGSGLGLSLVREVVDAHGGRVEVASTPGTGATFRVFLPAASAAEAWEANRLAARADRLEPAENGGEIE